MRLQTVRFFSHLTCLAAAALAPFLSAQPNVVLVITDDQGYGDLSCHGNPVLETPHLDELHGESVRLTDFHVSPTCAPTRGALMSGHFTNRAGPWHTIMGKSFLFEGEKTLGEVFAGSGYATGMFGKWHLGDNYPFRPEDRGFHEVVRHGGGGVGQTPDFWDNSYFDDTYFHNSKPEKYEGYCTDVYFQEAKRFIGESAKAKKPFFAYISTNAPHGPFHCPEKYTEPYLEKLKDSKNKERVAVFFGMIANIDENVGALRSWLEEEGLAEDTLFIFMTDNGTASGANVHNSGMRANKGSMYDGGHRVPFFLHWPKGGLSEGRDIEQLTAHIDVLPTLIDLLGLQALPVDYKLDGRSLVPLLKDEDAAWPARTLVTDSQRVREPKKWRNSSTMTERWRLINGKELYDIQADPGQKNNLAKDLPDVVEQLRADYDIWWDSLAPSLTRQARIVVGSDAEPKGQLTSHDWVTESNMVPWNQAAVRSGPASKGFWALKVAAEGKYRVTLRRWPRETGAKITASLAPGAPVPGLAAFRETPGKALAINRAKMKIGEFEAEQAVGADDTAVSFEVELEAGDIELEGVFTTEDDQEIGAYFAEVEKL
ncbi:arylsulfatase [Roseibacillus persicicus]|uniref:N-acetylgalactosamine-6-sulfatase n=1 Tax=Roseibacillus persicicus TaxID=454148 RepID=A0A918TLN0_9BACT|nr:arylsulfatase [Roseibacillus persicicus]GHC47491.1 N-acetylgalactosamine-6-sulfatase [Roseibacillus persicicus]